MQRQKLRRSRRWLKRLLGLGALLLGLQLLPHLFPIQASALVQTQAAIAFVDRSGLPLGTILTRDQEHTVAVPLSQVAPTFRQAIVAAEDQRFYQHGAIDVWAIGRAVLEAIQSRQVMSGASTITMQLARMIDNSPRHLGSKLHEMWTASRLEAGMTKDEILTAYINRLPMGGNIYGVEAAARLYFGVPASDLTLAQSSLLAAIPNDPNHLNPTIGWEALKQRQRYVLDRLVQDGYLTQAQANSTATEKGSLQPRPSGIVAAPHFLFWLASQQPKPVAQVQTTIDRSLQQFVESQVQAIVRSLSAHNVRQAAALVLDNHTGNVLAYVGSPDYADNDLGRNDGVQALRQPGSALKPFLYELALTNRVIQPNTVLADIPTRYAIPGAKLYNPADYSEKFQGPVRVRVALANSLNVPAVRVLEKTGVSVFLDRLHQLGFAHLTRSPDYYGLGLALGSGEVSLWELTRAYTQLARQGNPIALHCQTADDPCVQQPILPHSPSSSWALITAMLADAEARSQAFGVDSLLRLPFPAAVKTGTSSDFRDTWTIGFTTDYTVGVWVGNFDGSPMRRISGVTGAAPLWNRILLHLHESQEPIAFPPPRGMVRRAICALSGARPTPACPTTVQEYLFADAVAEFDRQPDPFYQTIAINGKVQTRLTLPAEYNEWLAMQLASRPAITTGFRILSPRTGDVFLLDAASSVPQKLEFKLTTTPAQPIEWRLNGRRIATQTSSVFWLPQPGAWTLEAKSGTQSDRVHFEVSRAEMPANRHGFSFAAP